MTRHDFLVKWGVYALALLPVWFLECYILARYPFYGIKPMLLPLAVAAVAVLEGAAGGAGFGLGVGLLGTAVYYHTGGGFVVLMTLLGLGTGLLTQYILRQDFWGCLLCSALSLGILDGTRILPRLLYQRESLEAMLHVAGGEILWSLVFTPLVYLMFLWVFRRVPKRTHF